MDNFMTRRANKLSAQEMIKANEAAEAAHRQQIENQNKQYEEEIAFLRQNAQNMEKRLGDIELAIKDLKNTETTADTSAKDVDAALECLKDEFNKRLDKSDEATHDVGVRIYRNVQASVIDEQKKQLDEIKEDLQKQMDGIRGEFSVLLRRLDTTRNQLEEDYKINNGQKEKGLLPLGIIILLVSIADLVFNILRFLGLV